MAQSTQLNQPIPGAGPAAPLAEIITLPNVFSRGKLRRFVFGRHLHTCFNVRALHQKAVEMRVLDCPNARKYEAYIYIKMRRDVCAFFEKMRAFSRTMRRDFAHI